MYNKTTRLNTKQNVWILLETAHNPRNKSRVTKSQLTAFGRTLPMLSDLCSLPISASNRNRCVKSLQSFQRRASGSRICFHSALNMAICRRDRTKLCLRNAFRQALPSGCQQVFWLSQLSEQSSSRSSQKTEARFVHTTNSFLREGRFNRSQWG